MLCYVRYVNVPLLLFNIQVSLICYSFKMSTYAYQWETKVTCLAYLHLLSPRRIKQDMPYCKQKITHQISITQRRENCSDWVVCFKWLQQSIMYFTVCKRVIASQNVTKWKFWLVVCLSLCFNARERVCLPVRAPLVTIREQSETNFTYR